MGILGVHMIIGIAVDRAKLAKEIGYFRLQEVLPQAIE